MEIDTFIISLKSKDGIHAECINVYELETEKHIYSYNLGRDLRDLEANNFHIKVYGHKFSLVYSVDDIVNHFIWKYIFHVTGDTVTIKLEECGICPEFLPLENFSGFYTPFCFSDSIMNTRILDIYGKSINVFRIYPHLASSAEYVMHTCSDGISSTEVSLICILYSKVIVADSNGNILDQQNCHGTFIYMGGCYFCISYEDITLYKVDKNFKIKKLDTHKYVSLDYLHNGHLIIKGKNQFEFNRLLIDSDEKLCMSDVYYDHIGSKISSISKSKDNIKVLYPLPDDIKRYKATLFLTLDRYVISPIYEIIFCYIK